MYASARGEAEEVQRLLRQGAPVSAVNYDRRSALHVAAAEGHVAVVAALIAGRADVNPEDRWSRTPLDEANRASAEAVPARLGVCAPVA